jgi:hypothetical protein
MSQRASTRVSLPKGSAALAQEGPSKDLTCTTKAGGLGVAHSAVPGDDVQSAQQGNWMGTQV